MAGSLLVLIVHYFLGSALHDAHPLKGLRPVLIWDAHQTEHTFQPGVLNALENHGAKYDTRFKLLRERVLAMKEMWTKEQAEFHGEFVNFDPIWINPKPKQKPHPPLLLGGETDHTLKRVVEFCDGWFPRARGGFDPKIGIERLKKAAVAGGRDPKSLTITVFAAPADGAKLAPYREAGIDRVLLEVPDKSRDEILATLDRNAALIKG